MKTHTLLLQAPRTPGGGEKRDSWQRTEITSVLPTAGQKFPCDILRDIWNSSRHFNIFYLLIPRFLAEPLTMFCETLIGKLCLRL
jgi:hypothetical protein